MILEKKSSESEASSCVYMYIVPMRSSGFNQ